MKALVLAAGLGTRLRPLTLRLPKALVEVGGQPMLGRHLHALSDAGFEAAVVNTAWLAGAVHDYLKTEDFGLPVAVSHEGDEPLDTGGAMLHALPLLGDAPFVAVNADVVTDFDFSRLMTSLGEDLAHLILVPNPTYRSGGDFALSRGRVTGRDHQGYTFSGMGVYHPEILQRAPRGRMQFSVVPLLESLMKENRVGGSIYRGMWHDTGTPERLREARQSVSRIAAR